jgi:hypothetical protein
MKGRKRIGRRGYSTVEFLVALALGLVVAAGITAFNYFQLGSLRDQGGQVDVQSSTRAVADLFANEIRRAGMGGLTPAIESYFSNGQRGIRIQADLNGNSQNDGGNEDVVYAYGNGTLVRITNGTSEILLEDVDISGQLEFYGDDGSTLATMPFDSDAVAASIDSSTMESVRRIAMDLQVSSESARNDYTQLAMISTDVNVRDRFFLKPPGSVEVDESFLDDFDLPGDLQPNCQADGTSCSANADCCSNSCSGGICGAVSACLASGSSCSADSECCSGICIRSGPPSGRGCS